MNEEEDQQRRAQERAEEEEKRKIQAEARAKAEAEAKAAIAEQRRLAAEAAALNGGDEAPDDDKELAMNLYMTEALIIFVKNQFLLLDFTKNTGWQVGDYDSSTLIVDEDASLVMVDPQLHQTNEMQAIATGGCKQYCLPG